MIRPDPTQARGYRNRNPGNIVYVPANKWQGQIGLGDAWLPTSQRRFAAFESHEYGIRALAALLTTYQDRHGLRTVREIINRWAPPKGDGGYTNPTSAYVRHVEQLTGWDADKVLDLHRYDHMRPLVVAIITHELAGNPYPASTIDAGLLLAGLARPVESVAAAAGTGEGRAALTVGSLASAAAAAAPAIQAVGGLPQWVGVALVLAAAAVGVAFILSRRKDAPA